MAQNSKNEKILYILNQFTKDEEKICLYDNSLKEFQLKEFQIPFIIFFLFKRIKKFEIYFRTYEKVNFIIPFKYKNVSCIISDRKFGVFLSIENIENVEKIKTEILCKIKKATQIVDKLLQEESLLKIQNKEIRLPNFYNKLYNRYNYFRKLSHEIYNSEKTFEKLYEASFYVDSMINCFFSLLEHIMDLAFPFTNNFNQNINLLKTLKSSWKEKFKQLFDLKNDIEANKIYSKIYKIKNEYRNTIAHGFLNENYYCDVMIDDIGYIPLSFSKINNSIHYKLFTFDDIIYKECIAAFDSVLDLFESKYYRPFLIIKAGLEINLEPEKYKKYKLILSSDENTKKYIDYEIYIKDVNVNMDW